MAEATVFSVQAASLTNWNFDPAANQLEITVKDGTTPRYFLMAQPARIVIDLPDTAVGAVSAQKTYAGAVRQIRVSQFEPGLTRIVMEISPGVSLAPGQVKLQKVGNDAARSGNSRWLLQPLITRSLSANAVAVKPLIPLQQRTNVTAPATKPLTAPAATIAPSAEAAFNTKPSIAQPQPSETASNVLSPPISSSPPASASPTTASRNDEPAVAPSATAAPSVALAPVLPALPTSAPQTVKPPASVVALPVDPNVAVDTHSGVAIAVPTPTAVPSTTTLAANRASLPTGVLAPTETADLMPRAAASMPRSISSRNSAPATVKPATATVVSRLMPQPTTTKTPAALSPSALDIPTTVAAASLAPTPTVSVPPLSTSSASPNFPPAQSRQPDTAIEAPPDGVPTGYNAQPNVSVPPPMRVGTPSLGLPTIASPVVEAAPPTSVFSPNTIPTPPVAVPSSQLAPTPTTVQPGDAPTSYDANTVRQPSVSSNLAPPLNSVLSQTQLQPTAVTVPSTTPGYDATTIRQPPVSPAPVPIVEFGQPLPATSLAAGAGQPFNSLPNPSDGVRQAFKPSAPNVLLPAGTTLNLRYSGSSTLSLNADRPQQEMLVLLTELRDGSGNLLAPAGSTVTGRFETTTSGSQFVTQAIVVAGRTVPLAAQSDAIDGSRNVEGNNLALNSGIGVLAGGVLGAIGGSVGLGALGGAAAGAATTLLTAPKPATIQPGQVVQVRLTQDLRGAE